MTRGVIIALAAVICGGVFGTPEPTRLENLNISNEVYTASQIEEIVASSTPGDYAAVSNAAMNALSRAEVEAGFTEWNLTPSTYMGEVLHLSYNGSGGYLLYTSVPEENIGYVNGPANATSLVYVAEIDWYGSEDLTATRVRLPTMTDMLTTNDVCSIVTNLSNNWSCELGELIKSPSEDWTGVFYASNMEYSFTLFYSDSTWTLEGNGGDLDLLTNVGGPADSRRLVFNLAGDQTSATLLGTTRIELVRKNALGLARYDDVPSMTSNTVTKAYVEGLGIEAGVDAQTVTNMTTLAPVYSGDGKDMSWLCNPSVYDGRTITIRVDTETSPGMTYLIPYAGSETIGFPLCDDGSPTFTWTSPDSAAVELTATRIYNNIIGYTLGAQTNIVLAATNGIPTRMSQLTNDVGYVTLLPLTNGTIQVGFAQEAYHAGTADFASTADNANSAESATTAQSLLYGADVLSAVAIVGMVGAAAQSATNYTDTATNSLASSLVPNNALAGQTFDFATMAGMYLAISNLVHALGGSMTNFPAIPAQ